ncbi:hypothetical protein XA68_14806 [Ophiocordyceps unilateralis]|uniref:Uncharacterized protein n=1 Tax=Ophiocordyceps unilateralis TaxID=268505 RepID=A0A2A9P840_OPHUN|nr:hypothetical protein XA68_14806 [Ophiocordyceps unilateralis]
MRVVFTLLTLLHVQQWVAAYEGIQCGNFQKPSSKEILDSIEVEDHERFKAQYINAIHLQAVFSVLPANLLVAINTHWRLNTYDLAELLADDQRFTSSSWHLRWSIWYYRKASAMEEAACWISDVTGQVELHKNVLGAINNLLLSPHSANYNMPRRIKGLPSGLLREDRPICFAKNSLSARWFENHLPAIGRPGFQEDATLHYLDFAKMKNETDTWAGTFGRVVFHMLLKAKSGRPMRKVRPGVPIPAATYGYVIDKTSDSFRHHGGVCYTLGKMEAGSVPTDYYWIDAGNNAGSVKATHA